MDWYLLMLPVPGRVDFGTLGWLTLVSLVAMLAPLSLAARQALGWVRRHADRSRPRVIGNGGELSRCPA